MSVSHLSFVICDLSVACIFNLGKRSTPTTMCHHPSLPTWHHCHLSPSSKYCYLAPLVTRDIWQVTRDIWQVTSDALPLLIGRSRLLYKIPKDDTDSFDAWLMNAISNSAINGADVLNRQTDRQTMNQVTVERQVFFDGGNEKAWLWDQGILRW